MKKVHALIAGLFTATSLFFSCTEDEMVENSGQVGESIQFGLNLPDSRTIYDSNNTSQINWVNGDKISIYCNESLASKKSDYTVTPASETHKGSIAAAGSDYLQWGGMKTHHFYAVYPSGITVNNGIVSFPIVRDQKCIITTATNSTP